MADALDRGQVEQAVRRARPDAIVTMLTAVPARVNPRRLARDFALTNRLRTEGTRHLLEAGATVGVRRFISQGAVHQPRAGVRVPARGEAGRRGRAAVDPGHAPPVRPGAVRTAGAGAAHRPGTRRAGAAPRAPVRSGHGLRPRRVVHPAGARG